MGEWGNRWGGMVVYLPRVFLFYISILTDITQKIYLRSKGCGPYVLLACVCGVCAGFKYKEMLGTGDGVVDAVSVYIYIFRLYTKRAPMG